MINIIFDYNRTLFNPDNNELFNNTHLILEKLSNDFSLFLLSYNESGRQEFLQNTGIEKFFKNISLVDDKNEENMLKLIDQFPADITIVVGDRIKSEIIIGNNLGYKTVWLQKGKFSSELPEEKQEEPDHIIYDLEELLNLLEIYKKK